MLRSATLEWLGNICLWAEICRKSPRLTVLYGCKRLSASLLMDWIIKFISDWVPLDPNHSRIEDYLHRSFKGMIQMDLLNLWWNIQISFHNLKERETFVFCGFPVLSLYCKEWGPSPGIYQNKRGIKNII